MSTNASSLRLAAIFGDHMVLQRDAAVRIWGWAAPGCSIRVDFAGRVAEATCPDDGRWQVDLVPLAASSESRAMTITATGGTLAAPERIIVADILVGDVWLCSGQSNMEMLLGPTEQAPRPANASVRLFNVTRFSSPEPEQDVVGLWKPCTPENARAFSAVAYWFGEYLQNDIGVPVGLVNASWGGTQVEWWMTRDALKGDPAFAKILARAAGGSKPPSSAASSQMQPATEPYKDRGNEGLARGFADPDHAEAANWPIMDIPRYWETTGLEIDGAVWFRRDVDVPAAWAGRDLTLELGALDDFDTTYFNGAEVGRMGLETPSFWSRPRIYTVPAKLVKAGRNVIATRIFDQWGPGGFAGTPEEMKLSPSSKKAEQNPPVHPSSLILHPLGDAALPLAGPWRWQIELALEQKRTAGSGTVLASMLYNGMIAPLVQLAVRGVAWYQGESNAERAHQYRKLLAALIADWRTLFRLPGMPFLIVQLPHYKPRAAEPRPSAWAELREAQDRAARTLKNVGLAVTIDLGDADDIHPKNKQPIGRRLALEAGRIVYGRDTTSGPRYASHAISGDAVRVRFGMVNGRLATMDGKPVRGFAIAGADKVFAWANARIDGPDAVVVSSGKVPMPVAVRYAWADNPDCNLGDAGEIPAAPFRTDDWPGVTVGME